MKPERPPARPVLRRGVFMILCSLLMMAPSSSLALDGGIRVRIHEIQHHEKWIHDPQMQSRIGLLWGKDQAFGGRLMLQDVRRLSEMTSSQAGTLMLHQAYVRSSLRKGILFDAGRRELEFGGGRLVSSAPWSDRGRAFDGIFLTINDRIYPFGMTAWATQPGTPGSQGKRFAGIYLQKSLSPLLRLEAWWMRKQRLSSQTDRHTLGGAARWASRILKSELEGSYQLGTHAERSIAAWGASLVGQWRLSQHHLKPRIGAELNLASGDSDRSDQTDQTFDSLYAEAHRFWGHLDLMGGRNARDIHVWLGTLIPINKIELSIHGHLLSLQTQGDDFYLSNGSGRGLDSRQAAGSDVGTEIDVVAKKTHGPESNRWTINLGLSVFLPGSIAKISDLGEAPIFGGYLQLQSRFR